MSRYNINVHESKYICRKNIVNGNKFYITRGLSLKDISDAKRNTVYLDGAFKGPLFDAQSNIYSLDHHENCIRQITKSTCEQALLFAKFNSFENILLNIVGNDPDLDTILAGWLLLNIDEVQKNEVFQKILPLILVAGNIDSYGFGYEEILGLSKEIITQEKNRLEWLRKNEVELKQEDRWNTIDFVDYTLSIFDKIDEYVFFKSNNIHFDIDSKIEKFQLKNKKNLCFIESKKLGIYDAEKLSMSDEKIACIILSNGEGKYTIKLTNLINEFTLTNVWMNLSSAEMLAKNKININADTNSQLYFANWGGSSNIGGSPRYYNGNPSFLNSENIIQIVVNELNAQIRKDSGK